MYVFKVLIFFSRSSEVHTFILRLSTIALKLNKTCNTFTLHKTKKVEIDHELMTAI